MTLREIRKLLGPPSGKDQPWMNARDVFEGALSEEQKRYPGRDATKRVCRWFTEGLHRAGVGPDTVPIAWVTLFRGECVAAMAAGIMHKHHVWIDPENEKAEVCP